LRRSTRRFGLHPWAAICIALAVSGCGGGARLDRHAADSEAAYPADATSRYARALGYMDAGDDARAVAEFERIIATYPEYAGPHVNLGIIHERNGRPDAALSALQRAVEICSGCAAAYNQLGILQRRQGRFGEAEQAYLAAIESDPGYALAYFNLGVLYDLYQGRPELALQYYEAYQSRRRPVAEDQRDAVDNWIIDLRRRVGEPQKAAGVME
jgi:tetratricopeptide (TPR) repeat protein